MVVLTSISIEPWGENNKDVGRTANRPSDYRRKSAAFRWPGPGSASALSDPPRRSGLPFRNRSGVGRSVGQRSRFEGDEKGPIFSTRTTTTATTRSTSMAQFTGKSSSTTTAATTVVGHRGQPQRRWTRWISNHRAKSVRKWEFSFGDRLLFDASFTFFSRRNRRSTRTIWEEGFEFSFTHSVKEETYSSYFDLFLQCLYTYT